MARGNDGNLLQHAIEAEVAERLLAAGGGRGIHLLCTHSMEPFEPLRRSHWEKPDRRKRFERWWQIALSAADDAAEPDSPAVLRAYRRCRREVPDKYPNTAEIVATLAWRDRMAGTLIERDEPKYEALVARWAGTAVRPGHASWRQALAELTAPPGFDRPWLFTMDPFTYTPDNGLDDGDLHPRDFDLLRDPLRSWMNSGQPGAFCVFCYAMTAEVVGEVQSAVGRFRDRLALPDVHVAFAEVGFSRTSHVGAMLSADASLLNEARTAWIAIRDSDAAGR